MSNTTKITTAASVGAERLKADTRTFGGLLLVLGICATYAPLANVAGGISPGNLPTEGVPLWGLIGGVLQFLFGTVAMVVAYMALVHDHGNRLLTGTAIVLTQLAWIPFMTDLSAIGMGIRSDLSVNPFVPASFNPTSTDVKFVGSMGLLGVVGYAIGFIGSLGFMEFSLYAYQSGKFSDRSSSYYRGRMNLYMFTLSLAGLTQLLLGAYLVSNHGTGPYDEPVAVAMYVVHFPIISIMVGAVQLIMGLWGFARRFGLLAEGNYYQMGMLLTWILVFALTIMTQISWGNNAAAAPSVATLMFGLHVMPAFLDYKARTTPEALTSDYYGAAATSTEDVPESAPSQDADEQV